MTVLKNKTKKKRDPLFQFRLPGSLAGKLIQLRKSKGFTTDAGFLTHHFTQILKDQK